MAENTDQGYSSEMFVEDINVKLRDMEEKQTLLRDRILLIGENLLSEKQEKEEQISDLKFKIKEIETNVEKIKLAVQRIIDAQEDFARKSQLEMLERQFNMFQPLDVARIKDVEEIIKKTLKK